MFTGGWTRSTLQGEVPTTLAVFLAEADLPELMPSFGGMEN
jgi:hypothetical protein